VIRSHGGKLPKSTAEWEPPNLIKPAAELMVKDANTVLDTQCIFILADIGWCAQVGFDFCITELCSCTVSVASPLCVANRSVPQLGHRFNLRYFPFGVHRMPIQMALRKQRDSSRFYLSIADGGFEDFDEAIPYYAVPKDGAMTGRAHLPGGWEALSKQCGLAPLEVENFFTSPEWLFHIGGKAVPWDISNSVERKPQVAFHLVASRQFGFYLYQVMLVNSGILSTMFVSAPQHEHCSLL
jgi:hypothetical protein